MFKTVIIAFAASFVFIFLKALQQRNVAFDNYKWVFPTSLGMAFTEYGVIALIASRGYHIPLVLAAGVGAGLGSMVAMCFHHKYIKTKNGKKEEGISAATQRS